MFYAKRTDASWVGRAVRNARVLGRDLVRLRTVLRKAPFSQFLNLHIGAHLLFQRPVKS